MSGEIKTWIKRISELARGLSGVHCKKTDAACTKERLQKFGEDATVTEGKYRDI